jgi:pyruvate dehydrogenase E1 component alpha subunit
VAQLGEDLYRGLYLARASEQAVIENYPEDEMRTPMHMSMGQEHIPVGICQGLDRHCDVFASYRSHATFLAQTMDTDRFFAELYGKISGTAEGKAGSMHLSAPTEGHILSSGIVASPIPVAVGAAFANKRLETNRTTVVFFGDGAVDSGVFWESLNAACLFQLPVFLVCEDNGLAVHTPISDRRGYDSLIDTVSTYRCLVYEDAGNDVEEVHRIARDALAKIKKNPQPVFMNIECYRYLDHIGTGEDWHYGYRSEDERETWDKRDSLAMQRGRLLERGLGEADIKAMEREIDERIRKSVARAKAAPFAEPERLHHGVFHENS